MYAGLAPGAIGVHFKNVEERVHLARTAGFQGVEIDVHEIADYIDLHGAEEALALFAEVKACGWGVPFDWRGDEKSWHAGLAELPRLASSAKAMHCTRCTTWILPGSNELTMIENRRFHVERLKPIARVLADHGCRLGLEYVSPKTLRDSFRYQFIYRSRDMLEMAKEIGDNVGLLVDSWHWYAAGETAEDLLRLSDVDVVYVHVNDAPAGVHVDQQVDNVRCLPGETGVIDIGTFLHCLQEVGYSGPLVAEPFKDELGQLPRDEALRLTRDSIRKILTIAGVA